jgi:tight adherence protein B
MDPRILIVLSVGVSFVVLLAAFGVWRAFGDTEARRLRRRLDRLSGPTDDAPNRQVVDVENDAKLSAIPGLDLLLRKLPIAISVQTLLLQGDAKIRPGAFLLLVAVLVLLGAVFATAGLHLAWLGVPMGLLFGSGPFLWAVHKKKRRVLRFEKIFPDALDILTGALRSGLAFSGAVQVVADECPDPVAREFTILFEETRLGNDTRLALRNLARRVDSQELHLFVIAILLQRDTGGNLTEILEQTANVIRERLRILGDVRALTAQARLSGMILALLPMALAAFILASAPDYLKGMIKEPMGRYLLVGAGVLQIIGFLIMRRIAQIKV